MNRLYRHSLELLTDLYQLTMAYGYWNSAVAQKEAVFHLFYRRNPFGGGYAIAAGLEYVVELLQDFRFRDDDIEYLAGLHGNDGGPLFAGGFLDELRSAKFVCDVDAIPEGTIVFPHEPLIRVTGPLLQCQILETALLNIVNFQTLIATKSSRICHAADGDPVLEFGLRRAQGIDGALAASRAAFIGGCAATSNVLAGKLFGIPVKGTHAHSWIMSFDTEPEAFDAYAQALPNNCVFLVDTYDTLEGVRHAVETGRRLRARGHEMVGIRLDSGDLSYLSIQARRILNEAGFDRAIIVASNELDEELIASLKQNGAAINVWGVGTRLVTGYDQPALGGVYKLSALRQPGGEWDYRIKLSEQAIKISSPGILQVRRFRRDDRFTADVIFNECEGIPDCCSMVDPLDSVRRQPIDQRESGNDLLVPVFRRGKRVYELPDIREIREHRARQMEAVSPEVKMRKHAHRYPVGLESGLHDLKTRLVQEMRSRSG